MFFRKKKRAQAEPETPAEREWRVQARRFQEDRDGQMLEYPGRVAICPRGHMRSIPTRFDQPVVQLRCAECGTSYPLNNSGS